MTVGELRKLLELQPDDSKIVIVGAQTLEGPGPHEVQSAGGNNEFLFLLMQPVLPLTETKPLIQIYSI